MKTYFIRLSSVLAALAAGTGGTYGQVPKEIAPPAEQKRPQGFPPYRISRQDEDYTYLRDAEKRADWWDPIKYISLNHKGDAYLTLGGEQRERYEYYGHRFWGLQPPQPGYLLQRTLIHADLHTSDRFRIFAQLESSVISGNKYAPGPTDKDELDTLQLFADYMPVKEKNTNVTVRVGRQDHSSAPGALWIYARRPMSGKALTERAPGISIIIGAWTLFWSDRSQ